MNKIHNIQQLYEKRVLSNVRLTKFQMQIIAMICASPDQSISEQEISDGPNLTAAREQLTKLGLIANDDKDQFIMTDSGEQIAQEENIIDDNNNLTEFGNSLAYEKPSRTTSYGTVSRKSSEQASSTKDMAPVSSEYGLPGPSESTSFINQLTKLF